MVKHRYISKHKNRWRVRFKGNDFLKGSLEAAIKRRNEILGYDPDKRRLTSKSMVGEDELKDFVLDFYCTRGLYDPTFRSRVQIALSRAKAGELSRSEYDQLQADLKASWVPWSEEDIADQKAHYQAIRAVRAVQRRVAKPSEIAF